MSTLAHMCWQKSTALQAIHPSGHLSAQKQPGNGSRDGHLLEAKSAKHWRCAKPCLGPAKSLNLGSNLRYPKNKQTNKRYISKPRRILEGKDRLANCELISNNETLLASWPQPVFSQMHEFSHMMFMQQVKHIDSACQTWSLHTMTSKTSLKHSLQVHLPNR